MEAALVSDASAAFVAPMRAGVTARALGAKVFIVDDEGRCDDVRRVLDRAGYDVEPRSLAGLADGPPGDMIGCVLFDLDSAGFPGRDVPGLLESWRWPYPVILMSTHGTIPEAVEALRAGVADFVTKPVDDQTLLAAVEEAVGRYRAARAAAQVLAAHRDNWDSLTPRERQVAVGIARGQLNKQVAYDLGLTLATIKFHRHRLLEKLGVQCVPELVLLLKSLEVLPPPVGPVTTCERGARRQG